jgi:hypothetical protein
MLYGERIGVCSEIHTKHVNKAESYYRLRSHRAENTGLCIYVSWPLVASVEPQRSHICPAIWRPPMELQASHTFAFCRILCEISNVLIGSQCTKRHLSQSIEDGDKDTNAIFSWRTVHNYYYTLTHCNYQHTPLTAYNQIYGQCVPITERTTYRPKMRSCSCSSSKAIRGGGHKVCLSS